MSLFKLIILLNKSCFTTLVSHGRRWSKTNINIAQSRPLSAKLLTGVDVESDGRCSTLDTTLNYGPRTLFCLLRQLQGGNKDDTGTRRRVQREDRFLREKMVFAKSVEFQFSRGLNPTLKNSL